jgi:hypothetical protein
MISPHADLRRHNGASPRTLTGNSILSALLIVNLIVSVSACIEGGGSASKNDRARSNCPSCKRQLHTADARSCSPVLKEVPSRCEIRGLARFHIVAFGRSDVSSPLWLVIARVVIPSAPVLRKFSIGSPESDRGPPFSWKN